MIVKSDEAELLDNALASVAKHVDEIVIVTEAKGLEKVCKKYGAKLYFRDWDDNFANQRNFCLEKCTCEFIAWIDADDSVKHPEKLKKIIEMLPDDVMAVFANYIYQRDKNGNVLIENIRERIVRRNSGYTWVGALHETLMNESQPKVVKTDDFVIVHNLTEEDVKEKSIRNIKILEKELANQLKLRELDNKEIDPRIVYYLGCTYKDLGINDQAEDLLRQFVSMSGWDEHKYGAYLDLVDIAISQQAKKPAMDYALLALGELPHVQDAYFMAGKVCCHFMDFKKAVEWLEMGFSKNKYTGDWILVGREQQAYLDMAISSINLGDFKKAIEYFEKLKKMSPKDKKVKELLKEAYKLQEMRELTDGYIKVWKSLDKKGRRELLKAIPKEISDSPVVIEMERDCSEPKVWSDKSIVIFCDGSWEDWSPKSAVSGIGGSEEAVISISRELTSLGWEVTVYNSCGADEGTYDKVRYVNSARFNSEDTFNILIGWRRPGFFNKKYKARRTCLWMHDVEPESAFTPVVLANVDKVMCLSKYHRELWPSIPEEKIMYSANGILPEQFNFEVPRKTHSMIYSSCPSRGLELLLDMWSDIKEKYKDAELNVYYGFENYIRGNREYPNRMKWVEMMQEKLKQPGIKFHGRVGHLEIAKAMKEADIWAYPCIFPEISCITALKSLCGGCVPVVIPYGAVGETLNGFGYQTGQSDLSSENVEEYKDLLLKALGEKHDRNEMMEYGKTCTWARIAENWTQNLK
jgi:tetratricopeptide (TPR) repeat protein